eukprot:TRINITY_DN12446_c0_g2_i1.p1 TRINITY_DN12446_c0_g2~~TRINITY_DN12446_c0_g2_i1.p1  ORF type:complete len:386 (+),score=49.67 TRINITY_DN12446_c0_g2_i1:127-1158(+)
MSSDRVCSPCPGDTYQTATNHVLTSCTSRVTCGKGQYASASGSSTSSRVCKPCPADTWQDASSHSHTACKPHTSCTAGTYASSQGSATTDRQCRECPRDTYQDARSHRLATCKPHALCPAGTKVSLAPTRTVNRQCAPCDKDTYQSRTAHTEAACLPHRVCSTGQFASHSGSKSTDRVCKVISSTTSLGTSVLLDTIEVSINDDSSSDVVSTPASSILFETKEKLVIGWIPFLVVLVLAIAIVIGIRCCRQDTHSVVPAASAALPAETTPMHNLALPPTATWQPHDAPLAPTYLQPMPPPEPFVGPFTTPHDFVVYDNQQYLISSDGYLVPVRDPAYEAIHPI